jgi:hypothetical protein
MYIKLEYSFLTNLPKIDQSKMETINASAQQEKTLHSQPICPACGAPLILLRDFYHCFRCCYSVCESCDTEAEDEE